MRSFRINCRLPVIIAGFGALSQIPSSYADSRPNGARSVRNGLGKNFIADTVEIASPSVCNIVVSTRMGEGSGSGFVISSRDGLVVTNAHVVMNDPNSKVQVTLWDGRKRMANVHAVDRKSDIALLRLLQPTQDDGGDAEIPEARIGKSAALRAGDFVIALGSPLRLSNTVTFGIVSQTARYGVDLYSALSVRGAPEYQRTAFIQTDAAITRGNSGGPLVNIDGEVIGINTLSAQGVQGLSFAIPIDAAMAVIDQLRRTGRVRRPYIGLQMQDFFDGKKVHVRVRSVESGSPAARAGLATHDTILSIDGKDIDSVRDVFKVGFAVDRTYRLRVRCADGYEKEVSITPEPEKEERWKRLYGG